MVKSAIWRCQFEDQRWMPVPQLAAGLSVYGLRRPRMAEEGVPENAEVV